MLYRIFIFRGKAAEKKARKAAKKAKRKEEKEQAEKKVAAKTPVGDSETRRRVKRNPGLGNVRYGHSFTCGAIGECVQKPESTAEQPTE